MKKKIRFIKSKIYSLFLLLLISDYILISPIELIFKNDHYIISFVFRFFILLLSIFIISKNFSKFFLLLRSPFFIIFITFWLFYLFKCIYNLYFLNIVFVLFNKKSDFIYHIIFVILIPSISLFFINKKYYDFNFICKCFFSLIFFCLILAPINGVFIGGRFESVLPIYSISLGQLGATLTWLSLLLLLYNKVTYLSIFYFVGSIYGLFILYISASRSPLISLFVILFLIFYYKYNFKKAIVYYLSFVLLITCFIFFYNDIFSFWNSSFLIRIENMLAGNSSDRYRFYSNSLTVFFNDPIFGKFILLQDANTLGIYPHNIILEVLISTGLFGLSLIILWFYHCYCIVIGYFKFKQLNFKELFLILLLIQYLILSIFSYSILTNNLIWFLSVFVFSFNNTKNEIGF